MRWWLAGSLKFPARRRSASQGHYSRRGRGSFAFSAKRRPGDPQRGQQDQCVSQNRAVLPFGTVGFGSDVPVLIVDRQHVRLGGLVERVYEELQRKHDEEDRGHLEKKPEIDAMSVARPRPGKTRRKRDADERAPE